MRFARFLAAVPMPLVWACIGAALVLTAKKLSPGRVPDRWAWCALALAAAVVFAVALYAALRRLAPHAGVLALDRHHGLAGRLANAVVFSETPVALQSPMMTAAILDAHDAAAGGLSARDAVPIRVPSEFGLAALSALVLMGVALAEVRIFVPLPKLVIVTATETLDVSQDDLELFREALRQLEREDQSPELREAVLRFNRLIEDLSERRLSRDEAFRRMRELDDDLARGAEEDRDAMKDALSELAKELTQSDLAKPAADALSKQDYKTARAELKKLTDRLSAKKKPDKAQLDRLKKALDRASQSNKKALDRLEEKRAELQSSLLKAKAAAESKPGDEREKSLLKKKERELERLSRDTKRREAAARKLSRLERNLGKAAADLLRDLGASAEDLQSLTEDLNRLEQEELSDKEKDELRKRIQELRDLIRQQGQGGDKLKQRLQRFMKQARGSSQRPGQSKPGAGKKEGRGSDPGDDGDLRPGAGQQPGDGEGEGEGQGGGLKLGRGGKSIPIEVPGGQGSSPGDSPGSEGGPPGGTEAGRGSAEKLGKASDIDGRTIDIEAQGLDTGRGKSNAEVILGAADRGFTGKAYRKVFKQYQTVAEERVEKEKIPDGMRFYVRRYFQLIRPRE